MVSKFDIGILGLGALAVFLIIRGAGQKLDNLTNPLAGVGDALGGISLPSLPSIGNPIEDIGNAIRVATGTGATIGEITDRPVPTELIPTEAERISGNQSILEGLFGPDPNNAPGLFQPTFGRGFTGLEEDRPPVQPTLPLSEPSFQQAPGGSFIGGAIFDTPIENLSLSQIIDKFNVTASQAANIQAQAQNNFPIDFDFGTNTGSGIGGVSPIPDINTQLPGGNVSNSEFAGLSPTEIAQRLTGGIISNF